MLSPYRVLDLTDHRGELAAMILGDLGADVIRVEPPLGSTARQQGPFYFDDSTAEDPLSLQFFAFNRNKRSIALELSTHAGREEFLRLRKPALASKISAMSNRKSCTFRSRRTVPTAPMPTGPRATLPWPPWGARFHCKGFPNESRFA